MIFLLLILLFGCSNNKINQDESLKFAKDFCSCKDGIYFISFKDDEFVLECNVGSEKQFYYKTKYYGKVCR